MNETQEPLAPVAIDRPVHAGWFPVQEESVRRIKRTFDDPKKYRKALLAYVTLLRLSNLKGVCQFSERIGAIADDMGYRYDEAAEALQLVKQVGLCEIEAQTIPGTKERAPSLYTVKHALPEIAARLPEKSARLPFSSEADESPRVPKNSPKNVPRTSPKKARPQSQEEISDYLLSLGQSKADAEFDAVDTWEKWTANGFTNGGQPINDWRLTLKRWHRQGFLHSQKRNGIQRNGAARQFTPVAEKWETK